MNQRLLSVLLAFFVCFSCLGMVEQKEKSGVFWGAFDPMTEAHREIIKNAMRELALDEIIVVVNNQRYKKYMFPLEHRREMVQTALKELAIERARVIFQDDNDPVGYEELRNLVAGELYAIAGFDSYKTWCQFAPLHTRAKYDGIAIIPRGDDEPVVSDENARVLYIDPRYKNVSSTQMRKFIEANNK